MKIAFVGFGNMAQAIAKGLSHNQDHQLSAASPSLKPSIEGNLSFHHDNLVVIEDADVIVLGVKPAKTREILREIAPHIPQKAVLVSIAAGVSLGKLQAALNPSQAIVRCMPNLPIAVGLGAVPMIGNANLNTQQKTQVEQIFKPTSLIAWLDDESLLNPFTALSGSGPAYVFLFVEAMVKAAINLGIPESLAVSFTLQTFKGAITLLEQGHLSPRQLREKVTSPAGTTAAALTVLQQYDIESILSEAMQAACDRAEDLGR